MTPSLLRYRPFDIGGQSLECDQPVQRMKVLNQLSHAVSAQSFVEAPETTPSKAAGLPEEVVENLLRVGQRFQRLHTRQRSSSSLPFGLPAAPFSAASSMSSHASCIRTGTTQTTGHGATLVFLTARPISAARCSMVARSASRWTKSRSQGNNSTLRSMRSARLLGGFGSRRRSENSPWIGCKPQDPRNSQVRIGTRERSDDPSATSV